jgi:hypothetical protein
MATPADSRQVPGELFSGGGYHYYPQREQVLGWPEAAGFAVVEQSDGDDYEPLLVRSGR